MSPPLPSPPTVAGAINGALHDIFERDERVYLLGEDLLDPYGGAFKIARGLSTRWPKRVLTTPVSEAAFVGICGGMALRGLRPVAEIMFGDFMCLAFDQIVNSLAKFRSMYNDQVACPVVIRTPMGGRRGYGPTHSQSLEKHFVGVPGLEVVAPSPLHDFSAFYSNAVLSAEDPTIIIENKLMYGRPCRPIIGGLLEDFSVRASAGRYPTLLLSLNDFQHGDVTLITYGGMVDLALEVAHRLLLEHEIFVEVAVLGQLSPVPIDTLLDSVRRCRRAATLEEGTHRLGVGAEISCLLTEHLWTTLLRPVRRVAALDSIIPSTKPLEEHVLPGAQQIEQAIFGLVQSVT